MRVRSPPRYIPRVDPAIEQRVRACAEVLRRGGIVAYPTETYYGLGALAGDAAAVERLARAKGRPDGKPLPVVAADRRQVDEIAEVGPVAARLATVFWPGPLTLVLPARPGLAAPIAAGTGTVGVRVPGSEIARALADLAGGALVSTSANLSGEPPPARASDLSPGVRARLDAVLDAGPTPGGLASTIVAVEGGAVRLVRDGAVPFGTVTAALRDPSRWSSVPPPMAEIVPFRAIRYAATKGRALGELLAPPYDMVSLEQRDELLRRTPHNIIHVTLGEDRPGDGPATTNKYARAAEQWKRWLALGILKRDPSPALYPLEQSFWAPDGRNLKRRGVMAAVRLHEFKEGVIVPHEKTLVAPKADRLEVIKAVKANLSPIFGLYRDETDVTARTLDAACAGEPAAETDSDDGVHHRLWRCEDPGVIGALQGLLAPQPIFLADGHHRYETALVYRRLLEEQHPGLPADGGHHYTLMFLCPMSDPGLFLFATHRLVFGLKDFSLPRFLEKLGRYFRVETLAEDIRRPAGRAWAISKLGEHAGKSTTFLLLTAEDGLARVATLRDDVDLSDAELPANQMLAALDVTVLHSVVFQHLLGLSPRAQEKQENVTYVRDAGEAVNRVLSGEHQVGFLLNPTPMWQVEAVGQAGETMPQKSTLFYPRLQSGLVMREVNPFERP